MAETLTLPVQARTNEERAKILRTQNEVPCIIYGNIKNTLVKCKQQDLHRMYVKAGENTIVELDLDGKKIPVLFHSVDLDPISDKYEHIDFLAVDMNKEVTTHVPIRFVGESPAVKSLGAIFVTVTAELTVTCLPKDIPHEFEADIASLANFHDNLTVAAVKVPANVTVKEEADKVIATVQEPRAAEEEKPAEAAAEGADAAGAEGAAATPGAEGAAAGGEQAEKKDKK